MSDIEFNPIELSILVLLADDNPMGRAGWPLQEWERRIAPAITGLVHKRLVKERRLGGYPGLEITAAGRRARARAARI